MGYASPLDPGDAMLLLDRESLYFAHGSPAGSCRVLASRRSFAATGPAGLALRIFATLCSLCALLVSANVYRSEPYPLPMPRPCPYSSRCSPCYSQSQAWSGPHRRLSRKDVFSLSATLPK